VVGEIVAEIADRTSCLPDLQLGRKGGSNQNKIRKQFGAEILIYVRHVHFLEDFTTSFYEKAS
jgi:hypothetical protein